MRDSRTTLFFPKVSPMRRPCVFFRCHSILTGAAAGVAWAEKEDVYDMLNLFSDVFQRVRTDMSSR